MTPIILIIAWLLCGLITARIIAHQENGISIFAAVGIIVVGPISSIITAIAKLIESLDERIIWRNKS